MYSDCISPGCDPIAVTKSLHRIESPAKSFKVLFVVVPVQVGFSRTSFCHDNTHTGKTIPVLQLVCSLAFDTKHAGNSSNTVKAFFVYFSLNAFNSSSGNVHLL